MTHRRSNSKQVERVLIIEGLGNALAVAAKLAVGVQTGSLAIVSDAVHSMSDVANNVIAIVLMRVANRPADDNHPYGHKKFETLAVFGLAVLLAIMAWEIGSRAVTADLQPPVEAVWAIWVMLGVLAFNLGITAWERREAKRLHSSILHADATHTLGDAATTVVVIVGWQLSASGIPWLDRALALAIAGFVLYLAFKLFLRALPSLTDEAAVDADEATRLALAVPGVQSVRRVRSRWIADSAALDMIITVARDTSTGRAHEVTDEIENRLEGDLGVEDITIHVEPE